jgi:hypothetical protein
MSTHTHPELERELATLRAELRELREELRVMRMLQTAARVLLGFPPDPPDNE